LLPSAFTFQKLFLNNVQLSSIHKKLFQIRKKEKKKTRERMATIFQGSKIGVLTQGLVLTKQVLCHLATPSVHFATIICKMGVSGAMLWRSLDWPQTLILPISAAQIVMITGVSH
jgi:hypothetical protein